MYVKKKKNASGSTSVLVVSKDNHRRHRLVKNMGCGNTPSEISVLVSSAKEYIANTKDHFFPDYSRRKVKLRVFSAILATIPFRSSVLNLFLAACTTALGILKVHWA